MDRSLRVFIGLVVIFAATLTVAAPVQAACPTSPGGTATISQACSNYQINANGSTVEVTGTGSVLNVDASTFGTTGNTVIVDQGGSIGASIHASTGGASTVSVDGTVVNDVFGNIKTGTLTASDTANITIGADAGSIGTVNGNFADTIAGSSTTIVVDGGAILGVTGNWASSGSVGTLTNATANVTVNGGTFGKSPNLGGNVFGNLSFKATTGATGTITINGGTFTGGAEANFSNTTLTNSTGTTTINGGTVDRYAIGNFAAGGISDSTGIVSISGATVLDDAMGNLSYTGISNTAGTVNITNGQAATIFANVAGSTDLTDGTTGTVNIGTGATVTSNQTDAENNALGVVGNYAAVNIDGSSHSVVGTIAIGAGNTISGAVVANLADGGNVNSAQANVTVNSPVTGNVIGNQGVDINNSTATVSIGQNAVIFGDVYGNRTSGTTNNSSSVLTIDGTVNGNVIAGDGSDTATVTPTGYVTGIISGSSSLVANNFDGNTNVLTLNFGTTTSDSDVARLNSFGGNFGPNGTITINGKTYTWVNWSSVVGLLEYDKIVTWFTANDGRLDGNAYGRIIPYCHADKNTLGVLLVNNQSAGNVGTSFKLSKLEALGVSGTSVDFGVNGVLSIEMDPSGHGYAAWNGGVDGATGQGDFAKTFVCK